jgi:phosphatidylglycerol---prolipoprotein diacylglyceryl transferase
MHPLIPYFPRDEFDLPIPLPSFLAGLKFLGITIPHQLTIHSFGILVALGFILGAQMSMRKCRRDGLDPEVINRLLGWLVVGVFVGGHLGHAFFYEPRTYLQHPMDIFKVWEGLSSFGGFAASAVLTWWFLRKEKISFWPFADAVSYGLTLGWGFGRLGCFSVHDHPGTVTNFWLGVPGMCPANPGPDVACHDMGLYEVLFAFSLLVVFVVLDRKPRFQGFYTAWMCTLYAPARFVMDFLRDRTTDPRYAGLTPAQWGSFLLFAVGVFILATRWSSTPVKLLVQANTERLEALHESHGDRMKVEPDPGKGAELIPAEARSRAVRVEYDNTDPGLVAYVDRELGAGRNVVVAGRYRFTVLSWS